MRTLFYLSESQMERISPFFPHSHGILYVIKHGLQWKDAPAEYGPYKTLCNWFVRRSRLGVFSRIFTELANQTLFDGSLMITPLTSRPTARCKSAQKRGLCEPHRPDKGWIELLFSQPSALPLLLSSILINES